MIQSHIFCSSLLHFCNGDGFLLSDSNCWSLKTSLSYRPQTWTHLVGINECMFSLRKHQNQMYEGSQCRNTHFSPGCSRAGFVQHCTRGCTLPGLCSDLCRKACLVLQVLLLSSIFKIAAWLPTAKEHPTPAPFSILIFYLGSSQGRMVWKNLVKME